MKINISINEVKTTNQKQYSLKVKTHKTEIERNMPKAAKQICVWRQSLTPKPIASPCILLYIMYAAPASASHFPILKCTKTPRMWIALLFTCMLSVSFHSFLGVHPVPPSSCSESTGSASWSSACTIVLKVLLANVYPSRVLQSMMS